MEQKQPDFTSKETLDDKFWYSMCDYNMGFPVPLNEADLTQPFVYYRKYGVFYVGAGQHHFALSLLLAWEFGVKNYLRIDN